MNLSDFGENTSAVHALGRNRPLSLHLVHGTRVRALSGTLWLTQEGLGEDVMLAPGERFDVKRKGLIVMNAVAGSGSVCIETPTHTAANRVVLTPELVWAIEAKARRLRQQEMARLMALAARGLLGIVNRIWRLIRMRTK
jgi:hypothetical protein